MSKPAERNVHNADTPDFSVPDDGHGTPTSNTIGILLDACQTAKRITEALLVICVAALAVFARMHVAEDQPSANRHFPSFAAVADAPISK